MEDNDQSLPKLSLSVTNVSPRLSLTDVVHAPKRLIAVNANVISVVPH